MSKELVENCHYINARGKFSAVDIIIKKNVISFLIRDEQGNLRNTTFYKKQMSEIRELINNLLEKL